MKSLTVRLPDALLFEISHEARRRKCSKSAIVRERLIGFGGGKTKSTVTLDSVIDLIGSVDGLPRNLSSRVKPYLKSMRYGRSRSI